MKIFLLSLICLPAMAMAQTGNSPSELSLIRQKAVGATPVTCKLAGEDWAQLIFETNFYKVITNYMTTVDPAKFDEQISAIKTLVLDQPADEHALSARIFRRMVDLAKKTDCLTFDQSMRLNYLKTVIPFDAIVVESASVRN